MRSHLKSTLTRFFWLLLTALCLTGCGKEDTQGTQDDAPETVLSGTLQYTLPGLSGLEYDSILIGDTLYYSDKLESADEQGGRIIYRKTGDQEAETIAEFPLPGRMLLHYLADREGTVYYLYIEAEELGGGTAGYRLYLQKDTPDKNTAYRALVCEETVTMTAGSALWDDFPETMEAWYGVTDGAVDGEGRVCLYSRHSLLFLFDASGSLVCQQDCQPEEYRSGAGIANAGSNGCYFYETRAEKTDIRKIDMQTGALSAGEALPFREGTLVSILSGYDDGILVNTITSLYLCQPSGGTEHLLDWADFSLSGHGVVQACIDGDGFQIFASSNGTNVLRQMRIEPTVPGDTSGKQTVTLGIRSEVMTNLKEVVALFNAASPSYRVELVEYTYDYADGFNEVYQQLLKGEGPDIFELWFLGLPTDILADKGALEDLAPYLGQSASIGMEDILPRVIEAGSSQGRLVSLMPMFGLTALAVEQGHTTDYGWTPEQFLAYTAEHPDSAVYKKGTDCHSLLADLMAGDMDRYIDWEKRECSFDTEDFVKLLTSVKQTNVSAADIEGEIGKEGFLAGKYLVVECRISMMHFFPDAIEYLEGYGELAGYPASSGKPCFLMNPQFAFGINSKSGCKEGAWAFLEYVMDVDFMKLENALGAWPARIDAFERRVEEEAARANSRGHMGGRSNSFSGEMLRDVDFPKITEEHKEFLRFIVDNMYCDNREVDIAEYKTIILEEADAYFAGDKTAEEAARLIQNRVSLFLSE